MNTTTYASSRSIMNEMERRESLNAKEIKDFVAKLRIALRHEYKAHHERLRRLNSRLSTELSTELSTKLSTPDKEERSEKENLPPTPPIREKGKKEETPPSAATRAACTREDERIPTWEQVKARAEVSLKCKDLDWLREWFAEQECSLWRDGKGNALLNWGRALAIAWRYREIDDARRDPERLLADERRNEPEPGSDLIARQMAELSKEVRR